MKVPPPAPAPAPVVGVWSGPRANIVSTPTHQYIEPPRPAGGGGAAPAQTGPTPRQDQIGSDRAGATSSQAAPVPSGGGGYVQTQSDRPTREHAAIAFLDDPDKPLLAKIPVALTTWIASYAPISGTQPARDYIQKRGREVGGLAGGIAQLNPATKGEAALDAGLALVPFGKISKLRKPVVRIGKSAGSDFIDHAPKLSRIIPTATQTGVSAGLIGGGLAGIFGGDTSSLRDVRSSPSLTGTAFAIPGVNGFVGTDFGGDDNRLGGTNFGGPGLGGGAGNGPPFDLAEFLEGIFSGERGSPFGDGEGGIIGTLKRAHPVVQLGGLVAAGWVGVKAAGALGLLGAAK